jgi:CspA family cold shock protein
MLTLDELEPGLAVTHKNTGLRYTIGDVADEEVLLTPVDGDLQDLLVPIDLFRNEFVTAERYSARRSRGRRRGSSAPATPTGPKVRGRIKKMVRDRGFGFIRGDDGKEVFFHRSGLGGADYDILNEGDIVEYHVSESPRGPRAENVRQAAPENAA